MCHILYQMHTLSEHLAKVFLIHQLSMRAALVYLVRLCSWHLVGHLSRQRSLVQVQLLAYSAVGDPLAILSGDFYAGKGVGWARLQCPWAAVDCFNTHTSAAYGNRWQGECRRLPALCCHGVDAKPIKHVPSQKCPVGGSAVHCSTVHPCVPPCMMSRLLLATAVTCVCWST